MIELSPKPAGYVSHIWDLCGVIMRLCVPYLRPVQGNLEGQVLSARSALPTPPWKNTAVLHFSLFAAFPFSMRNIPCKTQCFVYLCRCCWSVPDIHEMSINPVRAARITDTTLEKHRIFAFLPLRRVALRYAQ